MHKFLALLSRRQLPLAARYGLSLGLMAGVGVLRFFLPFDTGPYLIFLPLLFLTAVGLGTGPGLLGLLVSSGLVALLFARSHGGALTVPQLVSLGQYVIVGAGMVLVCNALRRAIIDNDASLTRLADVNRILVENQASLRMAKADADAAREEALEARDAAEAANRAKSAFLANMSHELRTPLSAVIGYSEMLEEEAEETSQHGMLGDLGKIKSNAKHLLRLINDVLDLSKVEANRMDIVAEEVDVAAFTRDAAATVDALVRRRNNVLILDLGDGLGRAHTDALKLRQCLFNLLSNAAKFTQDGTITLQVRREASPDGDTVRFAVRDTGIGMSADQLARLFQRFSQADETTTRKFGGTGLGLALSRAFAKLLGGDVTVESRQGHGTCFTLSVPALMPTRQHEPVEAVPDAAAEDGREVVLVIDDEAAQRDLMTRFLRRQGFAVRTAADGRAGLDLARTVRPRVILLDVMMPEMDGWSVLGALKEDPATDKIPVVMVSFVAEAALSASLGAADAVPKPVDWEKLKQVMDGFRVAGRDVLVVDDDPEARRRLRTVLERDGWSVGEACDGAEALDKVMHAPPHLVLLDLTMPVMDGFSFLHRLRETPGCSDIPVVVLSARDITADERDRLASADGVFRKGETSLRDLSAELRKLEGTRHGVSPADGDTPSAPGEALV